MFCIHEDAEELMLNFIVHKGRRAFWRTLKNLHDHHFAMFWCLLDAILIYAPLFFCSLLHVTRTSCSPLSAHLFGSPFLYFIETTLHNFHKATDCQLYDWPIKCVRSASSICSVHSLPVSFGFNWLLPLNIHLLSQRSFLLSSFSLSHYLLCILPIISSSLPIRSPISRCSRGHRTCCRLLAW